MTILEKMRDGRIFEIYKDEHDEIWISECCDRAFGCNVSYDELRELGVKLIELADHPDKIPHWPMVTK